VGDADRSTGSSRWLFSSALLEGQTADDRLQVLPDITRHIVFWVHARVVVLHDLVTLGIADET
jgi:hypothetical protein